jgi:glycosyltransferase involved in cell wall biosynthesis
MYIEYPMYLAVYCVLSRKPGILVITSNTFYAPLIGILFSSNRHKIVHLVWDLFPDALYKDGAGIFRYFPYHLIKYVVSMIFRHANANIFLGTNLLKHAEESFGEISNSSVIPVGSPSSIFERRSEDFLMNSSEDVEMIYCGNFGLMHDSGTLLDALSTAFIDEPLKINLSFYASGSSYRDFKKNKPVNDKIFKSINISHPLSDHEWKLKMLQAHISLVTIKPGAEKIVMPSKTYSSLAAGQAILAICPSDSDLARLVRGEDCGWVVSPGNVEDLMCALREISSCKNILMVKRLNAYRAGHTSYSSTSIAASWKNILLKI